MKRAFHETMDRRMFDFHEFYSRIAQSLPKQSVIAEIGLASGASSVFLVESVLNLGKSTRLHMIDDLSYGKSDQLNEIVRNVQLAGIAQEVEIITTDSLNASCKFPDGHFDFVFIDSSHRYEQTKAEMRLWYRKIKEGGILAGHDYPSEPEVKQAVDEVVPATITRTDIPDRVFEPEPVLKTSSTDQGRGAWWLAKRWYVKLN